MNEADVLDVVIGIDHGNSQIKTANSIFPAGVFDYSDNVPIKGQSDILEIDRRFYALKVGHTELNQDKTLNKDYFVLTMYGIAKELEARGFDDGEYSIYLAAGLPPREIFTCYLERFKGYLMPWAESSILNIMGGNI